MLGGYARDHVKEVKTTIEHVGLYLGLIAYTGVAAAIFVAIEGPVETENQNLIYDLTVRTKMNFTRFVLSPRRNPELLNSNEFHRDLEIMLSEYERVVGVAAGEGINTSTGERAIKWTYIQAVFFAATILTTIGYGNIAPITPGGRVFCIIFAIIGIPFTLSVIADVGSICATVVSTIYDKYKPYVQKIKKEYRDWKKNRRKKKAEIGSGEALDGNTEASNLKEEDEESEEEDDDPGGDARLNALKALAAVVFISCFFALGSTMLRSIKEKWSFLDGFYFCFITMTTIGFGDIVPDIEGDDTTLYMLLCMFYIFVGLSFTTTIIELVRRQYAESWKKMQELRAQIQAQLKLANTLRQMADQAGKNNIEFEGLDIAGDLEELKKNIAKMKKGKYGAGLSDMDMNDLDWMDQNAKRVKAVTILIYETSV